MLLLCRQQTWQCISISHPDHTFAETDQGASTALEQQGQPLINTHNATAPKVLTQHSLRQVLCLCSTLVWVSLLVSPNTLRY